MEGHNTVSQQATAGSEFVQAPASMDVAAGDGEKLENPGGGGGAGYGAVTVASFASGGEGESSFRVKRKRGRPRKLPAGAVVEAPRQEFMVAVAESSATPQKRGRGRPKGTGKWQTLAASLGGTIRETAGTDFTPHIIAIQEGENIVQRIWSFSQRSTDSICILSAAGTISSAEVHHLDSPGRVLRYEGQFSIVYLGGSHTYAENGSGKICRLSVQLADARGRLCGGAVASSLIASGPTQLIIATFRQKVIRPQPIVRPLRIETPKPNRGSGSGSGPGPSPVKVTVPLQAKNSEQANTEAKGVATNSSSLGDALANEVGVTGPNVGQASSFPLLPVDWEALEASTASGSGRGTSSGLDTGVIN